MLELLIAIELEESTMLELLIILELEESTILELLTIIELDELSAMLLLDSGFTNSLSRGKTNPSWLVQDKRNAMPKTSKQ